MMILRRFLLLLLLFSAPLFASDSAKRKTVCLNMIVKNENEIITRCLESVLPIIDSWVIVDTGSTDGTQKTIREFLKHLPGELHERPWVNFGHNRQEALLLAKEKGDYILFMDADDKLLFSDGFKMPDLVKDFYAIPSQRAGDESWFPRLIKANLDWIWEGVVHEDLFCKTPSAEGLPLEGVKYVYIHDGARSKDPETSKKDIRLLEEAIKNDPNNPRNFFYLARSYVGASLFDLALSCFEKRSQMGGREEEVFNSYLMIGHLRNALKFDPKIVEESFFKAYLNRPHRAEPLYYLACKLSENGAHEKSYEVLSLALELPSNIADFMHVEKWIYDYGLLSQFALVAERTGHYREGIEACEKLLKRIDLPEKVRSEIVSLFDLLHKKNIQEIRGKLEAALRN